MCGIFGFSSNRKSVASRLEDLRKSLDVLRHRGPDSHGEFCDDLVYLGHRRLSIIDLSSKADQPLSTRDGLVQIVFNGEIYNYRELLSECDQQMITSSDTEVLLNGYVKHGIGFFKKLRGIYAFAIYDRRQTPMILLFRDLGGVKPLYFLKSNNCFAFASEIKALRRLNSSLTINERVLKAYLALGYCLEPNTIFNEIQAIEPGECLTYFPETERWERQIIRRYELLERNTNDFNLNCQITDKLLDQAVRRNMVSDVPVSFCLSGGIDSSLVTAHGKYAELKTICIKFDDSKYDESSVASEYANILGIPLDIVSVQEDSSIELLDKLLIHFDQPYADSSAIPFYILAREASKIGKVLIGGDGGDEIQNGYPSFSWLPPVYNNSKLIASALKLTMPFLQMSNRRKAARLKQLTSLNDWDDVACEWSSWIPPKWQIENEGIFTFDTKVVFDVFRESFSNIRVSDFSGSLVKNYFYKRLLSDYLRKTDMMSMLNGLEYRVPLLDEDLVEFSFSIPYHQKSGLGNTKKILRRLHNNIFPRETSLRSKMGFGIPLDTWLSRKDFKQIEATVTNPKSLSRQFVKLEYLNFLFKSLFDGGSQHLISRTSVYQRILIFYSLEVWNGSSR